MTEEVKDPNRVETVTHFNRKTKVLSSHMSIFRSGCEVYRGASGILDLKDERARAALMELGWTPPKEGD